jgi:hypothetical protein
MLFDSVFWIGASPALAQIAGLQERFRDDFNRALIGVGHVSTPNAPFELEASLVEAISAVESKRGGIAVPIYESSEAFTKEFPSGDAIAYQAVINNIPVVSEVVAWEQVFDFRRDNEATERYRTLRQWLRVAIAAKSLTEATDRLAQMLESYEWALRKHGVITVTGVLSNIIDSGTVVSLSAAGGILALAGHPTLGAITSIGLALSKGTLRLIDYHLAREDFRRGDNAGLAVIHDARKLAGA